MAVSIFHCSAGLEIVVTNANIKKKPTGLAVGVGGIDYFLVLPARKHRAIFPAECNIANFP